MNTLQEPYNGPPRRFFHAPMYRRAALWGTLGFLLVAAVGIGLQPVAPKRDGASTAVAMFAAAAIGLLYFQLPRIQVDDRGVSVRRIRRWRLYPWDVFAQGRVEAVFSDRCYFIPTESGLKRLELSTLRESDADWIDEQIHKVWSPGPEPAEADEIKCVFPHRSRSFKVAADRHGMTVSQQDESRFVRWNDVEELAIVRSHHGWPDFRTLTVRSGDVRVEWLVTVPGLSPKQNWEPQSSRDVAAFFLAHVPGERTTDFAFDGPPNTAAELDWREERARSEFEDLDDRGQIGQKAMLVLGFVGGIGYWWLNCPPTAPIGFGLMIVVHLLHFGSVRNASRTRLDRSLADIEAWRKADLVPASRPSPNLARHENCQALSSLSFPRVSTRSVGNRGRR